MAHRFVAALLKRAATCRMSSSPALACWLQDYELVSYSGTAQSTLVTLSRKLDTCDDQDAAIYSDTDQVLARMRVCGLCVMCVCVCGGD